MTNTTLADKVIRNFSKVKLKKVFVKVPNLKNAKKQNTEKSAKQIFLSNFNDEKTPASSIIKMLIETAFEEVKNAKKAAKPTFFSGEEGKSYTILKGDKDKNIGGYGAVSKVYGIAPLTSYVDYARLFSHLGKFRAKSAYENMTEHVEVLNNATESGSFVLADKDAMDKIGRYEKYMKTPVMDMPVMALSLVPIAGLSSGEWEEIKMLMKFDPVIYNLKTKTA